MTGWVDHVIRWRSAVQQALALEHIAAYDLCRGGSAESAIAAYAGAQGAWAAAVVELARWLSKEDRPPANARVGRPDRVSSYCVRTMLLDSLPLPAHQFALDAKRPEDSVRVDSRAGEIEFDGHWHRARRWDGAFAEHIHDRGTAEQVSATQSRIAAERKRESEACHQVAFALSAERYAAARIRLAPPGGVAGAAAECSASVARWAIVVAGLIGWLNGNEATSTIPRRASVLRCDASDGKSVLVLLESGRSRLHPSCRLAYSDFTAAPNADGAWELALGQDAKWIPRGEATALAPGAEAAVRSA